MRAVKDFQKNRHGNLNKTFIRHTKKRELPSFDQLDEFIDEIKTLSQLV